MARYSRPGDSYGDVPLSALLRAAQGTYEATVRRAYERTGCEDVPSSGSYILNAMHWTGASLEAVIRWMGVSKQAVGQAVETLVDRGYLVRSQDPDDRRRVRLELTGKGQRAGRAARSAIEGVDRELRNRLGEDQVERTRKVLIALLELGRTEEPIPARSKRGQGARGDSR